MLDWVRMETSTLGYYNDYLEIVLTYKDVGWKCLDLGLIWEGVSDIPIGDFEAELVAEWAWSRKDNEHQKEYDNLYSWEIQQNGLLAIRENKTNLCIGLLRAFYAPSIILSIFNQNQTLN